MPDRSTAIQERQLTAGRAAVIIGAAALAYATNWWPGHWVLKTGMEALGNPPYEGLVGAFLPHLLLYSTLTAAVSGLLWWLLVRARLLAPPQFGNLRESLPLGVGGGSVALIFTLIVVWAAFPVGTIHWIPPAPWKIAGNVFSNFYEEFIFRGFMLVALRRLVGFWPAAIVSSAMWAVLHTQFPPLLQAVILVVGIGFCWLAQRARSVWAPYIAHEVLDLIGDSLIG